MSQDNIKRGQKPLSDKERNIGFIYVLILFTVIVVVCGYFMFSSENTANTLSNKSLVVRKMDRLREFQGVQSNNLLVVDTLYARISRFEPGVNALYEENDIKYMINELSRQWENNQWDKRHKVFWHIASLYEMWFADKKELWSKQDNIVKFKKNLEECELGLQKKESALNSKGKSL